MNASVTRKQAARLLLAGILCVPAASYATTVADFTSPAPGIQSSYEVRKVADGLRSPDGLALHPTTGELYVADEDAGTIYVVRNGESTPALDPNWTIDNAIPTWALARRSEAYWHNPRLHSPEGIAFSRDGHLFVTEDSDDGRLLEFIPDPDGLYRTAKVIPIPWIDRGYGWESVVVASDGRLFLAGSTTTYGPGLLFGVVLMRDAEGIWFAIDYAPFAAFSALALSRDEDILVVGEEFPGAVTWWDLDRRKDIGNVAKVVPDVEGVAVTPNGTILMAQEGGAAANRIAAIAGRPAAHGGRVLSIHPETHDVTVLAQGFGTIESVLVDEQTGALWVTEDSSGSIYQLTPRHAVAPEPYLLARSLSRFEAENGWAPKRWPTFLKDFFGRIGVETRNESADETQTDPAQATPQTPGSPFTMQEFADRIPIVAGKVKTGLKPGMDDTDPITEIDFISLFPNQVVRTGTAVMPSLSLFSARHQSGHVQRSRLLANVTAERRLADGEYQKLNREARLYVPLTTCSTGQSRDGVHVSLSFLGMGLSPDYHMQLSLGADAEGTMLVEKRNGERAHYSIDCVTQDPAGNPLVNLVVAGISPRSLELIDWMRIGDRPSMSLMNLGHDTDGWISRWIYRSSESLVAMLEDRGRDREYAFEKYLEEEQTRKMAMPATPRPPRDEERAIRDTENKPDSPSLSERDDEQDNQLTIWTNMLLSRVAREWQAASFEEAKP